MIRSLFSKILLSHLLILIITTACIGLLLSHLITEFLIDDKRDELIREGTATVQFLEPIGELEKNYPNLLVSLSNLSGNTLWIADKNNNTLAGQTPKRWHKRGRHHMGNMNKMNNMEIEQDDNFFNGQITSRIYRKRTDDDPSIIVAVPFSSNPDVALFIHTPITGITKTSVAIQHLLLISIIVSISFAGLSAFFLSRSLTKPMREISHAAGRFAVGNYAIRTSVCGQDEVGQLGQAFNKMAIALERVEKNRREFFSDVTHELKTPIATIQAVTESILDGVVTDKKTHDRYLETILAETQHMNKLISELLDLARLESGQLHFAYEEVCLEAFLNDLKQKYHSLLAEKKQDLVLTIPEDCPVLETDPTKLHQILSNLLSNAIRHAYLESPITINTRRENQQIIFSITNRGEGISTKELPYLWERFYRIDKSRARNQGGTGLGLAITKKLVENMGGEITASSIPNQETTFIVKLPLKNTAEK